MEEPKYLIELFSHRVKLPGKAYLRTKHLSFLEDVKSLELNQKIPEERFLTFQNIHKEELLDLFEATMIHNKLTSLGVKCAIEEVHYLKE